MHVWAVAPSVAAAPTSSEVRGLYSGQQFAEMGSHMQIAVRKDSRGVYRQVPPEYESE